MPVCTLHLLTLTKTTDIQSYVQQLKQSTKLILASSPQHLVIHPTTLDNDPLATEKWDLLILLERDPTTTATTNDPNPIPAHLRTAITNEYKITTGIPSKLLTSYPTRNKTLQNDATPSKIPLTGSLDKFLANGVPTNSQNLEISPALLSFMETLSKTHSGPVTMLNLLHFQPEGGKQSYFQYGQAFIPVAGKRGGNAKLVGNVVPPGVGQVDSRSSSRGSGSQLGNGLEHEREWWNEISIVHYPSIRHFCDMLAGEDYQGINEKYRLSALRDTLLLCTTEINLEGLGTSASKL